MKAKTPYTFSFSNQYPPSRPLNASSNHNQPAISARPLMMQLPGGALFININTPDSNGVSYNRSELFNHNTQGIILNNAVQSSPLKLGGYTTCNPTLLKSDAARTIILHAVGPLPFKLQGYFEVAGVPATVVIANTQGIYCMKGGFINAPRVVLTTGKPFINRHNQNFHYRVTQGHIHIGSTISSKRSQPLNWGHFDLQLMARTVTLNTLLKAKEIAVVTGFYKTPHPTLIREQLFLTPLKKPLAITSLTVAIDITPRTRIDTEYLQLTSTEQAVSIQSAGQITTETLRLSSQGPLTTTGRIHTQNAHLNTKDTYTHKGLLKAQENLLIKGEQLHIEGPLTSTHLLQAKAQKKLISMGEWRVVGKGNLKLESQGLVQLSGTHHATGSIEVAGSPLKLSGSTWHAHDLLHLKANQYDIDLNQANTQSTRTLIETPSALHHHNSLLKSSSLQVRASALFNPKSKILCQEKISIHLHEKPHTLDSNKSAYKTGLDNTQSVIQAGQHFSLKAPYIELNNTNGYLTSNDQLIVEGAQLHNKEGTLKAKKAIHLHLPAWQPEGTLQSEGKIALNCKYYVHTHPDTFIAPRFFFEGELFTNQSILNHPHTLQIQAKQFHNRQNAYLKSSNVALYLTKLLKNEGYIKGSHIHLMAYTLQNKAGFKKHHLKDTFEIKKHTGIIEAETLYIDIDKLHNFMGSTLQSKKVTRIAGNISYEGEIKKSAYEVRNDAVIASEGEITIDSNYFDNKKIRITNDSFNHLESSQLLFKHFATSKHSTALQTYALPQIDWMPIASELKLQKDTLKNYLFEIDCKSLTQNTSSKKAFLSSDYLLRDKLNLNQFTQRLANGAYEQQKVREQIERWTSDRYLLLGENSDEILFKTLMDSAYEQYTTLNLAVGTPLNAQQISQLTHDIVWMVDHTTTLPDGEQHNVLVPQVYIASHTKREGAMLKGEHINLKTNYFYNNDSTVLSEGNTVIASQTITHQDALLKGKHITLQAKEIRVNNQPEITKGASGQKTIHDAFSLQAESLDIKSSGAVEITGAKIETQGATHIKAKSIQLKTAKVSHTDQAENLRSTKYEHPISSQIRGSDISLGADDVNITGSKMFTTGTLHIKAECDIQFDSGKHTMQSEELEDEIQNGFFSSTTRHTKRTSHLKKAIDNALFGGDVLLEAGHDLKGEGLQLVGKDNVKIKTGGKVALKAAADDFTADCKESIETSGFSLSLTRLFLGNNLHTTEEKQSHKQHQLGHMHTQGSLAIDAKKELELAGYDQKAADTLQLEGSQVELKEVMDTHTNHLTQKTEKSSLSMGAAGGLASICNQTIQGLNVSKHTQSKALAFAKNAQSAYAVGSSFFVEDKKRAQGVDCKALAKSIQNKDLKGGLKAIAVEAETSIGCKTQSNTAHQMMNNAQLASLQADKVIIRARDKDLKISGTHLKGKDVNLEADEGDITITQATNTVDAEQVNQHEEMKIGISAGYKGGVQGFIEKGEGTCTTSQSSTQGQSSILQADEMLTIRSKENTELKGAHVSGKTVNVKIGGKLTLESTLDTQEESKESHDYHIRIGVPMTATGVPSLQGSFQKEDMTSSVANVKNITMLKAGEGGFEIDVAQNTHLIGAGIQSEAPCTTNQLTSDTLQYTAIENKASYESSQKGLQGIKGQGLGNTLVKNATSNTSLLTSQPQERLGATEGFLDATQLTLQSQKQNHTVSTQPTHQTVEAYNVKEMQEKLELGKVVSELGMQASGDLVDCVEWKNPTLRKKEVETLRTALHVATATASAHLSGTSIKGAMAGAAAGNLAALSLDAEKDLPGLGKEMSEFARNAIAGVAGAAAGLVMDGKAGAYNGASQALIADAWNRQLHLKETETLEEFIKDKSPEEKKRFKEAAAYLTRASKGVPDSDTKKEEIKEMETRGKHNTEELRALRKTDLFQRTKREGFSDWLLENDQGVQKTKHGGYTAASLLSLRSSFVILNLGMKLHPLYVIPGGILTAMSLYSSYQCGKRIIEDYHSKEGQRVLDSFTNITYPGERNRPWELIKEIGEENALLLATHGMFKVTQNCRGAFFYSTKKGWERLKDFGKHPAPTIEAEKSFNTSLYLNKEGKKLTVGGKAVTKHYKYFEFPSKTALNKVYNTDPKLNEFSEQQIKLILRENVRTSGGGSGRFKTGWVTYTRSDGLQVSWYKSGGFIGFRHNKIRDPKKKGLKEKENITAPNGGPKI